MVPLFFFFFLAHLTFQVGELLQSPCVRRRLSSSVVVRKPIQISSPLKLLSQMLWNLAWLFPRALWTKLLWSFFIRHKTWPLLLKIEQGRQKAVFSKFLAHLLGRWAIAITLRPSSVNFFKHLLLWNYWTKCFETWHDCFLGHCEVNYCGVFWFVKKHGRHY